MPRVMTELSSVNKPASSYLNKDPDKDDISVCRDKRYPACCLLVPCPLPTNCLRQKVICREDFVPRAPDLLDRKIAIWPHVTYTSCGFLLGHCSSHRRNYLHGCVTKIILSGDFPGENQIISSTFLWTLSRDPLEDNQFRNLEKTTDCKCTSLAEATAKYEKSNI